MIVKASAVDHGGNTKVDQSGAPTGSDISDLGPAGPATSTNTLATQRGAKASPLPAQGRAPVQDRAYPISVRKAAHLREHPLSRRGVRTPGAQRPSPMRTLQPGVSLDLVIP
jgi:hypothetical protein